MKKNQDNPGQTKLGDFFGITKDRPQDRSQDRSNERGKQNVPGEYIPMRNFSSDDQRKNTPNKQNSAPSRPVESRGTFQSNTSSSSHPHINLDDCRTYALPCHIPKVWSVVKPKLIEIRDMKIQTMFKFLEVIHHFVQCHYSSTLKNLNLQTLKVFMDSLNPEEIKLFFQSLLPFLAKLALEVETLFQEPLYILKQNTSSKLTLNKKQVACLVANMFFCTVHKQNNEHLRSDCNFTNLYRESRKSKTKIEKLKCVYNYFKRIHASLPDENITLERLILKPKLHGKVNLEFWQKSQKPLRKCIVKDIGTIEDEKGTIQVDFANMMIGGGVLDGGCVQEEIRFVVSAELLVTLLITESLLDHEGLLITGTERYCNYSGYSETFKFSGDLKEKIGLDGFLRRDSMVLAIDAVDFSRTSSTKTQFKKERILREINKAYIGFYGSESEDQSIKKVIATGRWGCGAFQGDSQLKFVLQWLAASEVGRDMIFFRFEDPKLKDTERIIKKFKDSTVSELFEAVCAFNTLIFKDGEGVSLFDFLLDIV